MNIIFLTQGNRLSLFNDVLNHFREKVNVSKVGFFVTDSRFFKSFENSNQELLLNKDNYFLKEWEITREASSIDLDLNLLKQYENKIGSPNLWAPLVADRTLYNGGKYAYTQDYSLKLSHEEMLKVLQVGLRRLDDFFNKIKPDLIISFQCVTLAEYLAFLFSKSQKIKFFNIRPTRIKNFIYAGEDILEPSLNLEKTYNEFISNGISDKLQSKVISFLNEVRSGNAKYEGVIPPSNKSPGSKIYIQKKLPIFKIFKSLYNAIKDDINLRNSEVKYDYSIYSSIQYLFYLKIKRPFIAKKIERSFNNSYIREPELELISYAFFPLHTEPEVTLNLYSRPYLNQIEAIRLISLNLPVGMKLIVKEHPVHIGKRKINYYKKILQIPNVLLASPEINSRELIVNADLVTVICGSIGLEALFMRTPLIVLGRAPFNFLPKDMMRYISKPDMIGFEIRDLLNSHKHDENSLICYIGSNIYNSSPIDFYSVLSGRKEAFREGPELDRKSLKIEYNKQIERFSEYLLQRFNNS